MRGIKTLTAGSLMGLGMLAATPATAGLDGTVGIASEYVFRGIGSGSPQVWGGLDWSGPSGLYAGAWVSSTSAFVDSGGSVVEGNEEVDYYVGWGNDLFDLGAIYYAFPSQQSQANTGITEVYAGLSASFFSGYVWYAPSGVDGPDDDEYAYLDLNADFPVTEATSVSAHMGYLEPMGDAATNRSDGSNDGDFDFGLALHSGDYFMALTYLEGSGGGFSTIVGYSWSLPIE